MLMQYIFIILLNIPKFFCELEQHKIVDNIVIKPNFRMLTQEKLTLFIATFGVFLILPNYMLRELYI